MDAALTTPAAAGTTPLSLGGLNGGGHDRAGGSGKQRVIRWFEVGER
jgi:hypothetical protein